MASLDVLPHHNPSGPLRASQHPLVLILPERLADSSNCRGTRWSSSTARLAEYCMLAGMQYWQSATDWRHWWPRHYSHLRLCPEIGPPSWRQTPDPRSRLRWMQRLMSQCMRHSFEMQSLMQWVVARWWRARAKCRNTGVTGETKLLKRSSRPQQLMAVQHRYGLQL